MKYFLTKLLSAVSISATISLLSSLPTLAQPAVTKTSRSITPFALVFQAQQGRLRKWGISGYGAFKTQYMVHRVTAKSLVRAGIDARLIPAETLQDRDYMNAVYFQLRRRVK